MSKKKKKQESGYGNWNTAPDDRSGQGRTLCAGEKDVCHPRTGLQGVPDQGSDPGLAVGTRL